ncbi:hypothetical protein PAUR_b0589 [Pseudoalteromonas aurantia 208]|uniref:Uncharacterized protein n=1 Tax=Pseudoalteromonas aurantia 208 TaxID=1314867 RepID=A0ABR9EHQ7_9GAMM|nr:hypothetical protein [Pseudoalteromonas aurantia 208]
MHVIGICCGGVWYILPFIMLRIDMGPDLRQGDEIRDGVAGRG